MQERFASIDMLDEKLAFGFLCLRVDSSFLCARFVCRAYVLSVSNEYVLGRESLRREDGIVGMSPCGSLSKTIISYR